MKRIDTKPEGCKLIVVTNTNGDEYILQRYVVGENYFIPFVPHWNTNETTFNPLYWEAHYAKRETWIPISKINFDEWDITKEEYEEMERVSDERYKEILAKYHGSF